MTVTRACKRCGFRPVVKTIYCDHLLMGGSSRASFAILPRVVNCLRWKEKLGACTSGACRTEEDAIVKWNKEVGKD